MNSNLKCNEDSRVKRIKIYDLLGKELFETNQKIIEMSNFKEGIYLLKIEFENDINVIKKIIKIKV